MDKKEKYGFVYIWFDKKHKRFYIGCRWGTENDRLYMFFILDEKRI